jgi:hypothetical protein
MKLAIVGSRTFDDYEMAKAALKDLVITEIVSGGAKGADALAERYAKENNIPVKIFKPDWAKYGRGAGPVRNKLIVEYADKVIAFWDGASKGTKSSIDFATAKGKLLSVKRFNRPSFAGN